MPEVRFVVQQSWPLPDEQLAEVQQRVAALANLEFRPVAPPGPALYGDAKVLIVPHRIDNRPRVILEAQANGIPVIASRTDGLAEAVGDGGVTVDMDDIDAWHHALNRLLTDQALYDDLAERALRHSQREEVDPEEVARNFEAIVAALVDSRSG
jgi:glycosyltransferase involved in cell wall biosynthesis